MTRRTGSHSDKHIYYLYTYTGMQAIMQYTKSMQYGTEQRHEQGKALQPSTINDVQALKQFYLPGHGATTFTQINQEKDHLQRQGGQAGPLGSL